LPWVTPAVARDILTAHEVLHYFLGPHGTSHADRRIMNVDWRSPDNCLYTSGNPTLDDEQISVIQAQPRPAQNG
jgi:hypothetical protein